MVESLPHSPARATLRRTLTLMLLGSALTILVCAAAGFTYSTWRTLREALVEETYTIAEVLGSAGTGAIMFNSQDDANELLGALASQEHINSAYLYTAGGELLGQYVRKGETIEVPLHMPEGTGHRFGEGHLELFYRIDFQEEFIGTIYLHSSTKPLYAALAEQIKVLVLLVTMCFGIALALSVPLRRLITKPIDELVRAAQAISSGKDTRAVKMTDDELGLLADSFNAMLDRLDERQAELRTAHEVLEKKIVELDSEVAQRRTAESALAKQKTELEKLNEQLALSNRELDQFAYVASHDLQEPLRKIQTFGDRLRSSAGEQLGERPTEYLEYMLEAAGRMRSLIEDLLELSRVLSKGSSFRPIDLEEVARKVVSDLAMRIEETGAEIVVKPLPVIEGDPTQIYSLLQNLIGNSLKYSRPGVPPRVEISALDNTGENGSPRFDEKATIIIKDNGIGFDPQYADLIFRPFQRLHGRSEYSGTGIGLSICAKIVERHRGSIHAEGSPGEGAVFTITLPIRQTENVFHGGAERHDDRIAS